MTTGPADPGAPEPVRVALVDDQRLVRTGFRMVIDSQPDLAVVAEASDGLDALAELHRVPADVVLMDVRMPRMDGIEATRRILAETSGPVDAGGGTRRPVRVVVLTTFDLDEYAVAAIRAGASGFLLKDAEPEELLGAIRTVFSGDAVIAPSTTRRLLDRMAPGLRAEPGQDPAVLDRLTPREREVLVEMAHGLSNREIAELFVVSEATVKTHVGRVLAKLGARDRVQAVVTAYETGLVTPGDTGD